MSTEIYLPRIQESLFNGPDASTQDPVSKWNEVRPETMDSQLESSLHYQVSPWCASASKRAFDLICVIPALVALLPLLAIVAAVIRWTSPGSVIFRQQRAGRHRKLFTIYKFRTMVQDSEMIGPGHTAKDDPRITPVGAFLRRFKLDELPQLFNVLRGDMSLVGRRPKLPHHDHAELLCRPGITGAATLAFRDEQRILCEISPENLETFYQVHVVPLKLKLDADYMSRATLVSDIGMLFATVARLGNHLTHKDFYPTVGKVVATKPTQAPIALRVPDPSENLALHR